LLVANLYSIKVKDILSKTSPMTKGSVNSRLCGWIIYGLYTDRGGTLVL